MTKPILAVDADDTIFDENTAVRLYMNKRYNFQHTEADYLIEAPFYSYWEHIWNVDPDKMIQMYEEYAHSDYRKSLKPIEGAAKTKTKI